MGHHSQLRLVMQLHEARHKACRYGSGGDQSDATPGQGHLNTVLWVRPQAGILQAVVPALWDHHQHALLCSLRDPTMYLYLSDGITLADVGQELIAPAV